MKTHAYAHKAVRAAPTLSVGVGDEVGANILLLAARTCTCTRVRSKS